MFLEVFLGGCVEDSIFYRSCVRVPVDKNEFGNVHVVMIFEIEIKYTVSVFIVRKFFDKGFPGLRLIPNSINNLQS